LTRNVLFVMIIFEFVGITFETVYFEETLYP